MKDNYNPEARHEVPKGDRSGVLKIAQPGNLAQEFITAGKSFDEALGRCTIRDDAQKNAIILYKAQLDMFGMTNEINALTSWLNAAAAVGGFNRSLAAMTQTGIFVPQGAGIQLSREDKKIFEEINRERVKAASRDKDNNED